MVVLQENLFIYPRGHDQYYKAVDLHAWTDLLK